LKRILVISYIIYHNHLQMRIVNYTGSRFLRLELIQVGCCFYSYQNRGTKCLNEFYKNKDLFSTQSWWDKCGWIDRQGAWHGRNEKSEKWLLKLCLFRDTVLTWNLFCCPGFWTELSKTQTLGEENCPILIYSDITYEYQHNLAYY
jgi:hypothetical protein